MSSLRGRIATSTDKAAILPMMRDFNVIEGIKFREPAMPEALGALIADPALGVVALFELEGNVAGYGVLTWGFDIEFGGRDSFITELYLLPEFRGRGLGKDAIGLIQHIAKSQGANAIHLGVRPENAAALRLYQRSGFIETPRRYLTKEI